MGRSSHGSTSGRLLERCRRARCSSRGRRWRSIHGHWWTLRSASCFSELHGCRSASQFRSLSTEPTSLRSMQQVSSIPDPRGAWFEGRFYPYSVAATDWITSTTECLHRNGPVTRSRGRGGKGKGRGGRDGGGRDGGGRGGGGKGALPPTPAPAAARAPARAPAPRQATSQPGASASASSASASAAAYGWQYDANGDPTGEYIWRPTGRPQLRGQAPPDPRMFPSRAAWRAAAGEYMRAENVRRAAAGLEPLQESDESDG